MKTIPKGRGFVYIHDSQLYHRVKTKYNTVPQVQHYLILLKPQLIMYQLNAEVTTAVTK